MSLHSPNIHFLCTANQWLIDCEALVRCASEVDIVDVEFAIPELAVRSKTRIRGYQEAKVRSQCL